MQDSPRTHTRTAEQGNGHPLGSFKSTENQNSRVTNGGVSWYNVFGEGLMLQHFSYPAPVTFTMLSCLRIVNIICMAYLFH